MASIDIDGWNVQSYAHGWQVARWAETQPTDGSAPVPELREHRFYPSLPGALTGLMELKVRSSEATSLPEVLVEIRDFKAALLDRFTLKLER